MLAPPKAALDRIKVDSAARKAGQGGTTRFEVYHRHSAVIVCHIPGVQPTGAVPGSHRQSWVPPQLSPKPQPWLYIARVAGLVDVSEQRRRILPQRGCPLLQASVPGVTALCRAELLGGW